MKFSTLKTILANNDLIKLYLIETFCSILAIFVGFEIFAKKDIADLTIFLITILSLLIALLAYHINIKTYMSIDSVNSITKMDGNILENENYKTNIAALIQKYNAESETIACEDIISSIESLFDKKKLYSAINIANRLQYFVDVLVLLPFTFNSKNKNRFHNINRLEHALKNAEHRFEKINRLNNGSLILIEETIKLISSVIEHQKCTNFNHKTSNSMITVRGEMLKNSTSKVIYYNYMGLYSLNCFICTVKQYFEVEYETYSYDFLLQLKNHIKSIDAETNELLMIYLNDAHNYFKEALSNIHDDMMWNAFIKYNLARQEFFQYLLSSNGVLKFRWQNTMMQAIAHRRKLNLYLSTINIHEKSHIQKAFLCQELLARLLMIKFSMVADMDIIDGIGTVLYKKNERYQGLLASPVVCQKYQGNFNRALKWQKEIKNFYLALLRKHSN